MADERDSDSVQWDVDVHQILDRAIARDVAADHRDRAARGRDLAAEKRDRASGTGAAAKIRDGEFLGTRRTTDE